MQTETKKYLHLPFEFQSIRQKSQKSWLYIMCNTLWLNNIHVYFNNKTLSNLNRKVFECIICINFVSASNNCLIWQKIVISQATKKTIHFIQFLIYFNTFVSLTGSYIKCYLHCMYLILSFLTMVLWWSIDRNMLSR